MSRFVRVLLLLLGMIAAGSLTLTLATISVPVAAQTTFPAEGRVLKNANLRAGPGTSYAILDKAKAGQTVIVRGANPAGDWYILDSRNWIAAFLVDLVGPAPASTVALPETPAGDLPIPVIEAVTGTVTGTITGTLTATLTGTVTQFTPTGAVAIPPGLSTGEQLTATGALTPTLVVTTFVTSPGPLPPAALPVQPLAVIDGDTIRVLVGGAIEDVRYVGVDAPERTQPGFLSSSAINAALVNTDTVYLVPDVSERDQFGRLLRFVYRPDGILVNAELVATGFAQPATIPPDVSRAAQLQQLAVEAALARRGFWSGLAPAGQPMSYALTNSTATVYTGPGANYAAALTLPPNTPLAVLGRSDDGAWVQVRLADFAGGWVFVPQLTINVPVSTIPVPIAGPSGPTPVAALAPVQQPPAAAPIALTPVFGATPFPATGGPVTLRDANVRAGPGTVYPVNTTVPAGTPLSISARNADGTWYQLIDSSWIAAFLVANAPPALPIAEAPPTPLPTPTLPPTPIVVAPVGSTATPAPTLTPLPATPTPLISPTLPAPSAVRITEVDRGAEWVLLYNQGSGAQDLAGWTLLSAEGGEVCELAGILQPRSPLRIWAQTGPDGFSCRFAGPIWNNVGGDAAVLLDAEGKEVSRLE